MRHHFIQVTARFRYHLGLTLYGGQRLVELGHVSKTLFDSIDVSNLGLPLTALEARGCPLRRVMGHLGLGTELFVSADDSSRATCRNDIFNKEKLL